MPTLIIDNYDSFTYNLYQYVGELKGKPIIYRNNQIDLLGIKKLKPAKIIISPGPGNPEDPAYFGVCREAILKLGSSIPILGVCLGHQGMIHVYGGRVIRASKIMHGKTSSIRHTNQGIFKNIKNPLTGMRYHSLVGDPASFPKDTLNITAWVEGENTIMGIQHKTHPVYGIQFHPESIGTPEGKQILKNFLSIKT